LLEEFFKLDVSRNEVRELYKVLFMGPKLADGGLQEFV
jgi:hypothetical protein